MSIYIFVFYKAIVSFNNNIQNRTYILVDNFINWCSFFSIIKLQINIFIFCKIIIIIDGNIHVYNFFLDRYSEMCGVEKLSIPFL